MSIRFEAGQRVRLPGAESFVTVDDARETPDGWRLYLQADDGSIARISLTSGEASRVEVLVEDGNAEPAKVLAALWTEWMKASTLEAKATALATTPLRPYAHQSDAVYGVMLPQPRLRFLPADEPGTGKTIMAGLYLREMQRLGFVRRALIVVPAHLVTKWQADFERFFGGGLKRISAGTVQEGALGVAHDLWIVSLDLAAVNPAVQDAIRPDLAAWDVIVIDEAHRLTPTAAAYYRVGDLLCRHTPRALLMTATPHRGDEWLFRALMHLVDPEVFPPAEFSDSSSRLKPGPVHFLRRMKEDLRDYDDTTPLFRGRRAHNIPVSLNATEAAYYGQALDLVERYFQPEAVPLAKIVYGKRAASSLYALAETLRRRQALMGSAVPAAAAMVEDPDFEDPGAREEARVVVAQSRAAKPERQEIKSLLAQLDELLVRPDLPVSKWPRVEEECFRRNGIEAGSREQAVVFTEYADTADWLVRRFRTAGYSAERYSGRDPAHDRDAIRARFERREFQILVSTDAGNEGIDLQTARILVNWDIPWSLVRLEQRMGRIHRIGQERDVELYNLVATETREGEALKVLLDNFVVAADRLDGKLFDSLSLVAERVNLDVERLLARTYEGDAARTEALADARAATTKRIEDAARQAAAEQAALKSSVNLAWAIAALQRDALERINPRIVEAFLARQASAGMLDLSPHAAGAGLFMVSRRDGGVLPAELGGEGRALVASSGVAVLEASQAGADVGRAIRLGPGEPAFRALIATADKTLGASLLRGGALRDPTSVTDYDLFCREIEIAEAGARRKAWWPCLVRVDETGASRCRWEALANLEADASSGGGPHPAHRADAEERVRQIASEEQGRRSKALEDWLRTAERELNRLPATLAAHIEDPERRRAERRRVEQAVQRRLTELREMAKVEVGGIRAVGWARVRAAGVPPDPTEADSEEIAMRLVAAELRKDGWAVSDVHKEGRGYDLYAVRGRVQRCVEVKGVWDAAASSGVRLTGHELLIARQMAGDYWLCVVDDCRRGGKVYGTNCPRKPRNPRSCNAPGGKEPSGFAAR
ncbi:MAG: helicase-related protein, partial [Myxococcota bacterium]|nr:helicase-related protein [Myxococcota bacterium]